MLKVPSSRFEVIQLMSYYAPAFGFGGPIRLMYEYAKWVVDGGFRVSVLTGDTNHDFTPIAKKYQCEHGIHIRRVHVYWRRLVKRSINLVSPSMFLRAVWRVLHTEKCVIVHVCEVRGLVVLYGVALKKLFPKKVILVHSAFGMLHFKQSRRRQLYDRLFLRPLLCGMDLGLAQNDHEINQYRDYFAQHKVNENNRIVLFPLSTETQNSNEGNGDAITGKDREILRKKYSIPDEAFVCIFLGRLHPAKGILRAIDAFLAFSAAYFGQTFFLIVGRDDGMQQKITDYINERNAASSIRIVNNVYETRFEYYTLSNLFLGFPTIDEETMLASVEALSCGTPVLVSREADIPFVQEEGAGFVIDFSMGTAVDRMQRIAAEMDLFRQHAYKVAEKHFSESSARHHLITLFNQVLQKSSVDSI
ncbi:MAG TPA: glycosyltransferase [Nitrospirae bacterium]|nr:glycosyltransferase [Nitrospirota bacterium]